jgi:small-conductance mechanosensitive channel
MDDDLLASFIAQVIKIMIIFIGFLVFLKIVGWGDAAGGILATAGLSAFVIGFALKDIGENFLAGIAMAFNRPFKVGDVVQTGSINGKIIGLNLRETLIKTFDGIDVYIPNGQILKNPLLNYTIDGFLRHDFEINLEFESDIDQAVRLVMEALTKVEGLLQEGKPPSVTITGLTNHALKLKVFYWINTDNPNTSAINVKTQAIKYSLQALLDNGFHLPTEIVEVRNKASLK